MAAILFDKQNGTIAWRNEAHSKTPAAFMLVGVAFAGLADNDAIEAAFQEITARFPRKIKNQ